RFPLSCPIEIDDELGQAHFLASCPFRSCAVSAAAARTISRMKACTAGEARHPWRRPVEQTSRRRTRRQWARVDLDQAMHNAYAVGNELLGERRRRAPVLQPVLVAVPGTGHAAVDDAPFADRPLLVGAKIRKRPDLRAVAEDCDAFAIRRR